MGVIEKEVMILHDAVGVRQQGLTLRRQGDRGFCPGEEMAFQFVFQIGNVFAECLLGDVVFHSSNSKILPFHYGNKVL